MTSKPVRMAILDDGVSPEVCPLARNFLVDDDAYVTLMGKSNVPSDSHGSMCIRIVRQYTNLDKVDVISIQVLCKDTWRGNINRILKALELCASLDVQLIHLSVGTYAFEDFARLDEAVWKLLDINRFLVAATGNRDVVTYPAYLPGVFGVRHHPELAGEEYTYYYDSLTRIHFQASAKHKLITEGQISETLLSNSFAAPLITAKILSYLKANAGLKYNEVSRLLIENAGYHTPVKSSEYLTNSLVEIPAVVLSGFSIKRLRRLLKLLMDHLRQDGYNARVASNIPGLRPWDETVLPESTVLDHFIARMAQYFSCDILLLGLLSYVPPDRCTNVSLWIYGDENSKIMTTDGLSNEQILHVLELQDSKVYESMITMLT